MRAKGRKQNIHKPGWKREPSKETEKPEKSNRKTKKCPVDLSW